MPSGNFIFNNHRSIARWILSCPIGDYAKEGCPTMLSPISRRSKNPSVMTVRNSVVAVYAPPISATAVREVGNYCRQHISTRNIETGTITMKQALLEILL